MHEQSIQVRPRDQWPIVSEGIAQRLVDPMMGAPGYMDGLLDEALRVRATDLHFEASGFVWSEESLARLRIRMRIDGCLHVVAEIQGRAARCVLARVKVISNLSLGRAVFQEGRVQHAPYKRNVEIRCTAVPTAEGEHLALRLLAHDVEQRTLDELGMEEEDVDRLRDALDGPPGLVLGVGPTGAGKSTTVHALLREPRFAGRNVITIEDPVEGRLPDATQIDLRRDRGDSFAGVLASVLRMDPDAILVGEMREADAAKAAVHAATTGRFVFSTLHARGAADAVDAMSRRNVPLYDIASTLRAVIAQRLVRKICPCCSAPRDPNSEEDRLFALHHVEIPAAGLSGGEGCDACYGTGALGRTGIFQIMVPDGGTREAVLNGEDSAEIKKLAHEAGMTSLLKSGLRKAARGITTLDDLTDMISAHAC